MNTGCSWRHGTHHEAKTLTSDTSPLRSVDDSPSDRPLTAGRLNSGTDLPISGDGTKLVSAPSRAANATARPTNAISGNTSNTRSPRPACSELGGEGVAVAVP